MSGHYADDKSHDNLFSITKAVTSQYYYVPSLSELAALPSLVRIEVVNDGKEKEKEGASEKEKEKGQGKEGVEKDIKVYIEYWYYPLLFSSLSIVIPKLSLILQYKLWIQDAFPRTKESAREPVSPRSSDWKSGHASSLLFRYLTT